MPVTFTSSESTPVTVPEGASESLAAFRAWAKSGDVPDKVRTDYYKGEVWIEMGKEQVYSHGAVKSALAVVLVPFANVQLGDLFLINGVLVTNVEADLSGNPDMTLVRGERFEDGRVRLIESPAGGFTELEGTPDMVLEIVSPSSVKKDTVRLREAYFIAGIPEYWLIDARGDRSDLRILKSASTGYTESRKLPGGWQKSSVFGKSFRLVRATNVLDKPTFTLDVK